MRVLHVVTAFPRSPDDVIVPWLVELLKRLQAAGHEMEVFTSSYRGMGDQVVSGLRVHRFRYFFKSRENLTHEEAAPDRMKRSLLYRFLPIPFVLAGLAAIWRLCRRERYDIIHVHWPLPLALFGWAAQRARAAGLVTTFYGVELRWVKTAMPFLKGLLAWAARRSDRVVAISSYTAHEVRELADVPIEVIPYTSTLPEPRGGTAAKPADHAFTVLFVGRLVERKGVRYLVDAISLLPPELHARLVIVGEGPERAPIEAQVRAKGLSSQVEVRGQIPTRALESAYAAADVLVLPSTTDSRGDTEGLGVVLLEAMSHKLPVVASAIGGIVDIVADGETGLLVPESDSAALAAALQRLAREPALAARLGEAGYRRLRERFSWEAIVRRWEEVYAGVLGAERDRRRSGSHAKSQMG
jgi:glycosyltransferase involved in cell wall biosynthesis